MMRSSNERGWQVNSCFEIGPIRPPNEGKKKSLLLRINRNCPWNQCIFCPVYKGQRFQIRSLSEIKNDIDSIKTMMNLISENNLAEIFDQRGIRIMQNLPNRIPFHHMLHLLEWNSSKCQSVFLQDADALVMPTIELIQVIAYLKEKFPSITEVTSYSRSKTCARKSPSELKDLQEVGLTSIHVGLESGSDRVLEFMKKGVTAKEHIKAGSQITTAGIKISVYVMPGLGGKSMSEKHARETSDVLSQINPQYIRLRTLFTHPCSPLWEKKQTGYFKELGDDQTVEEIATMVGKLQCYSYLSSDHITNLLPEIEGQLPQDRERILEVINGYLSLPLMERLKFRLQKRTMMIPSDDQVVRKKVKQAFTSIIRELPTAMQKTEEAISALAALVRGF